MLRQKYSKKKRREKMKKNKKTRKIGGMKTRANTGSRSRRRKRQIEAEATRLSSRVPQQQQSRTMSPRDERDAQARFAELLGEKCEATKEVNDDGSIDCPSSRTKAKKKFSKFHPDKNPGCQDYAKNMMNKYNETCYGDDTNPNRKWDKNDPTWRNEEAERNGFYTTKMDDSSESAGASKSVFDHCTAKDKKSPICRVCGWTNDPKAKEKCLCCPDSPQAKAAAAKAAEEAKAPAPETVQRSPVDKRVNKQGFIEPPLTNSMSEMDEIITQRLGDNKTTPIECRQGDKSCKGSTRYKKERKKKSRKNCKRKGGKVINKNTRDEACLQSVELMEMSSSGSENRGRLPVSPSSIKDRVKNLEKQLTTPEPEPEQSITMATNQCAEVRQGKTTYFAEVDDGNYTGKVAASLKDPMCKPKLPAGWESHFDETHQAYYYVNTTNNQPQWKVPTMPAAETPSAPLSDDPSAPPLDVPDLRQGSVPIYTGLTDNNQCALMKSDGQEYVAEVNDNDNDGHVDYTGRTGYSPSDAICNKPPPNGWEMITDEASGQIYYYNSTTGQSSSTYPATTESSEPAAAAAAETPSTPESSEPTAATEDESKNKILDKTHGSCRYAKTPEGKEYLYNSENQTTWDKDSPICHLKDITVFGLNYRLTFAKVLHKSGIRV